MRTEERLPSTARRGAAPDSSSEFPARQHERGRNSWRLISLDISKSAPYAHHAKIRRKTRQVVDGTPESQGCRSRHLSQHRYNPDPGEPRLRGRSLKDYSPNETSSPSLDRMSLWWMVSSDVVR